MQTDSGRTAFFSSPNYKWYVVGMLWFIAFFNYADRYALSVSMPTVRKDLNLTDWDVALVTGAFGWVYGLGAPFAGFIIDRIRRKSAILFGLISWSIVCMTISTARSFKSLFVLNAAEGLGETFYFPASMSLISDYHGKKTRARAMSIHQTSVYGGTILGSLFAGLIADHYGWRWAFVVFGAGGVLLSGILALFLREPRRGQADTVDEPVVTAGDERLGVAETIAIIWRTPTVLTLFAAFVCANMVFVISMGWLTIFLTDRFALTSLTFAGVTSTFYLNFASIVGAPVSGTLSDYLRQRTPGGRMIVQACGVLCAAPFVVLCGLSPVLWVTVVAFLGWGFFKGVYDANIFASMYDVIPPKARGTAAGFMNAVGWTAGAIGPLLIALIKYSLGVRLGVAIAIGAGLYVAAGISLLIGAIFFVARDAERMQEAIAAGK